jgi:hypothetical protein
MGYVNKNYPLSRRVACLKEAKGGEENELSALVFLQEFAAFAVRVYTEDNNQRYKDN